MSAATAKTHGGARLGAGRKPDGRERITVRLKPELAKILRQQDKPGELVESAFDFWQRNQDGVHKPEPLAGLEKLGGIQDAAQADSEFRPASELEIRDGNQDGLALSFLAEFASLGRKHWVYPGERIEGTWIENIPLDLDNDRLREWVSVHSENDISAIVEAYRRYNPLAHRVLELLSKANPIFCPSDVKSNAYIYDAHAVTVDAWSAIERLHSYGLIISGGVSPCGSKDLLRFIIEDDGMREDVDNAGYWITQALARGRLDIAVAFGAGDYRSYGEEAVLEALRANLRAEAALDWWDRNPAFCAKVEPLIAKLAAVKGWKKLEAAANKIKFFGEFKGGPLAGEWQSLREFQALWVKAESKHGGDLLLSLFARFTTWRVADLKQRLGLKPPAPKVSVEIKADLDLLGLKAGATASEIKTAWKRFVQRHHPDKGGDHRQFTRVKAAYDRLNGTAP